MTRPGFNGSMRNGQPLYVDEFWDDLIIPAGDLSKGAGSDPEAIAFKNSLLYCFDDGDILTFMTQMSHTYKEETDLKLHLHWTPHGRGVAENGNTVNWRIDLSAASINGVFPAPTTYVLTATCDGTDDEHQYIAATVDVPGTGLTISHMLIGRVYRLAGDTWATNTAGNRPGLLEVDFHHEIDRPGSRQELTK